MDMPVPWICKECVDILNNRKPTPPASDTATYTCSANCWHCGFKKKCAPDNQVSYPNHMKW